MNLNKNTYDERLFKGGIRKYLHESRFLWLKKQTRILKNFETNLNPSVIEIGCFNCRSLDYLAFKPGSYFGLDAGWENGLDEAIKKYPNYNFKKSTNPLDIKGDWDLCLALETLEHLPRPDVLNEYLIRISKHSKKFIVTVPMEIGPLFLFKFLYKKAFYKYESKHNFFELFNQTFGRCHLVTQDNHKGFDYRFLIDMMSNYFKIDKIEGINPKLPKFLNTQIGIVATSIYK